MSRKRKGKNRSPKLCMFCGKDESYGPLNTEHFVPRGLWAGPRPSGTNTCPAHVDCNKKFADDNDYFRLVIVSDEESLPHAEAQRVLDGPITKMMVDSPGRYLRHATDFAHPLSVLPRWNLPGRAGMLPNRFLADQPRAGKRRQRVILHGNGQAARPG